MSTLWEQNENNAILIFKKSTFSQKVGSVQSLRRVWLFVTPWTTEHQASLSITNAWSLPKLVSIWLVMPSNHLILCHPFSSCLQSFPESRFFLSVLCIKWPKHWSFSFSISPSKEYSGLTSFRIDWFDLYVVQGTLESFPTPQFKSIKSLVLSFLFCPTLTIHTWLLEKP